MKNSALHRRNKAKVYARSLLDIAEAYDNVLAFASELDEIVVTLRESIELRETLTSKAYPIEVKRALLAEIFAGFAPEIMAVFYVMVERDDLSLLPRAFRYLVAMAEKDLDAVIIDVTTVVPLDDALREQIVEKYSEEFGIEVLLREHIDPNIVGGIILSAHGKRIDASVSTQLESAREILART